MIAHVSGVCDIWVVVGMDFYAGVGWWINELMVLDFSVSPGAMVELVRGT
jgi:hypothetical protein